MAHLVEFFEGPRRDMSIHFSKSISQGECFKAEVAIGAPDYLEGRNVVEKTRILGIED